MDVEIKFIEVNISNDGWHKMARIGDYWTEKKTTKIAYLLKEYQDVFVRDYKYFKGLVKETGEMKNGMILRDKPIKKRLYNITHKYK